MLTKRYGHSCQYKFKNCNSVRDVEDWEFKDLSFFLKPKLEFTNLVNVSKRDTGNI